MPGGRRNGSRNYVGHRAGGDRRSAQFKAKKKKEEEERAQANRNALEMLMKKREQKSKPTLVEHPLL